MSTLYISDLDGTLLNQNAHLSEYTIDTLNRLMKSGVNFTVATARTHETALLMLACLSLNIPIVLMNGVLIYDAQCKKCIKKESLSSDTVVQIVNTIKTSDITGFAYTMQDDKMKTYYTELTNNAMKSFVEERVQKFGKNFMQVADFAQIEDETIYFCFMDSFENIHRFYDEMIKIDNIRIEKYQDIYSNDLWYMEIFSDSASKYNAVKYLRKNYGFERVVSFGDNLNDLPMFKASDECYAVENANEEVKKQATAVIGSNAEDGVAKYISYRERR